jgi:hypothetical protein
MACLDSVTGPATLRRADCPVFAVSARVARRRKEDSFATPRNTPKGPAAVAFDAAQAQAQDRHPSGHRGL